MSYSYGRNAAFRVRVTWLVKLESPLHVGGLGGDVDTDLALVRDGLGRLSLPGTGLAGALRNWLDDTDTNPDVRNIWGFVDKDRGHASYVTVDDAVLLGSDGDIANYRSNALFVPAGLDNRIELHDGIGIDRKLGIAAPGVLYSLAVVPRGLLFLIRLQADVQLAQQPAFMAQLTELRSALSDAQIHFGAGKTVGLGRVRLQNDHSSVVRRNVRSREGMLAELGSEKCLSRVRPIEAQVIATDPATPRVAMFRPRVTISANWEADGPVMVRASVDGHAIDSIPLTSAFNDSAVSLYIPGRSVKGVLRTRAERILRTVLRKSARGEIEWNPHGRQRFLRQLNDPTMAIVAALFGGAPAALTGSESDDETRKRNAIGIGAVSVESVYSTDTIDRDLWNAVVAPSSPDQLRSYEDIDGHVAMAKDFRKRVAKAELLEATHVAIDRWTGGAAESALFTVLEPRRISWQPFELTLDRNRLQRALAPFDCELEAAEALLLLTLAEFERGDIHLGHAVNRGMGDSRVSALAFKEFGNDGTRECHGVATFAEPRRNELMRAWKAYIAQHRSGEGAVL